MNNSESATYGIELLVAKCRNEFRRPENTDHYAREDCKAAEKRIVKYCSCGKSGHSNADWPTICHTINRGI